MHTQKLTLLTLHIHKSMSYSYVLFGVNPYTSTTTTGTCTQNTPSVEDNLIYNSNITTSCTRTYSSRGSYQTEDTVKQSRYFSTCDNNTIRNKIYTVQYRSNYPIGVKSQYDCAYIFNPK